MSEKTSKKQRKLKKITVKKMAEMINKKIELQEKAIKNFMDKNNITIQDLKNHGIVEKKLNGTEIYKYKKEIIIEIKIVCKNQQIKINAKSKYLPGENYECPHL
jgi:hypothetical protein